MITENKTNVKIQIVSLAKKDKFEFKAYHQLTKEGDKFYLLQVVFYL